MPSIFVVWSIRSCGGRTDPRNIKRMEREHIWFPRDIINLYESFDGGEGFVGRGGYFSLWRLNIVIDESKRRKNEARGRHVVVFGGDGAGEYYAVEKLERRVRYFMIPSICPLGTDEIGYGGTFKAFMNKIAGTHSRQVVVRRIARMRRNDSTRKGK